MAVQTSKLHKTKIDLAEETRESMVELLNQQLADAFDLYSQTKQAHWNVKGPHFIAYHELFDKLAAELLPFVDSLAERVTALGGTALGTARTSAATSTLAEYPLNLFDGQAHVSTLSDRWAAFAASTRAAIDTADEAGDATTADLFTQISGALDKDLWFLEAHVQK